ncbi:MAG: hypothetical protein BGO41_05870 [Clostridiales bacterium 38-18]|nr:MAG: hypothetical protein BGO41_05870 [Clostridiales bacterium 38-18]
MKTLNMGHLTFENPQDERIPSIPLYMDQVLDYLEGILAPLKRVPDDTVFTKTMINNYVKSQILDAPIKKKYDKATIEDLILVYHLKQVFSIPDVDSYLKLLKAQLGYYDTFSQIQNLEREKILSDIGNEITPENAGGLLTALIAEITVKKQLAEQLLDYLNLNTSENIKVSESKSNMESR